MMPFRTLGSHASTLSVSSIGLGCMGMSYAYGASDETSCLATLDRALELGVTFFDTSDSYGPYVNEELLGPFVQRNRAQVVIASKFGQEFRADGTRGVNGRPEYVRAACEASLLRLGIDTIDLYYQHRIDKTTPVDETWGALSELVAEGKVRYLGLSEASEATIRKAHVVHPVTALQSEWSLWTRDVEVNGILATVRELGIGFVPYSPLGRGFLTGAITSNADLSSDDGRRSWPRFQDDAIAANMGIARAVGEVADQIGASPAQVVLAWLLAQGGDVVPIPGARKVTHLTDNCAAVDVQLADIDVAFLNSSAPVGSAVGGRYPDALMKSIDV